MFAKKFIEGPYKGLCFRIVSRDDDGTITLEFYGGRRVTMDRSDYNAWAEVDC